MTLATMVKRRTPATDVRVRPKAARGRPPVHQESWSKVSVVLFDRQIVHLDRLATDIRGRSGKVLNRAEITKYKRFYPESVYLSTVIKNLETAEPLKVTSRSR